MEEVEQTQTGPVQTNYVYTSEGQLLQVATPQRTIDYRHNALGQRVAKLINGQIVEHYLWQDLTTLLATYDGEGNLKQRFEYTVGHTPTSFTQDGQRYYIQIDHLGSPRVITDSNGEVIKTLRYDSYGNIAEDSNPDFEIPFGFAGGLYDPDTKLIRFGYRDYDPETGRWTARDPIGFAGGDTNLYGYVLGDPVNLVDPEGLQVDPGIARDFGFDPGNIPRTAQEAANSNRGLLPNEQPLNLLGQANLQFISLTLGPQKFAQFSGAISNNITKKSLQKSACALGILTACAQGEVLDDLVRDLAVRANRQRCINSSFGVQIRP